ncbi:MAG: hypothetical protein J6126_03310, partial [Clostridia bacterium]|nr:hypothetical protein [Clostridia bacterium]
MDFICTRSGAKKIGAARAVLSGASDSGYYVPETLPRVTKSDLEYLCDCDYAERAAFVMKLFFAELGDETIENICTEAAGRFERDDPAPLVCLEDDEYILELFHGKSGSQADINAAFLIPLICESAVKAGLDPDKICLLAFGADEGAAMISEAKKSPISHVIAVFDGEKTSMIQRKQLAELSSEGFEAIEIPEELNERIKEKVFCCGSEKKLVPTGTENIATAIIETVNFISAYCDVVNSGAIGLGDEINFAMPCGDLTNLLACKYARQMGVPIKKIV